MKKILCALLALALLAVFACAAAAEEAAAPQAAAGEEGGASLSGQVIFALTTGQTYKSGLPLSVSAWLAEGVLSRRLETDVGYAFLQVRKDSAPAVDGLPDIAAPWSLPAPDALYTVFSVVSGMNIDINQYSNTKVYTAYRGAVQRLLNYAAARESGGEYCAPLEIWWIDWYETPLEIPAGAVITEEQTDGEDESVAIYRDFAALLDAMPDMACHFVFLTTGTAPAQPAAVEIGVPLSESIRIADLLREQPQYAARVTVDTVSLSGQAAAAADVARIVQEELNAVIPDSGRLDAQEAQDGPAGYLYTYHFNPAGGLGDAMLTLTGRAEIQSVRRLAPQAAVEADVASTGDADVQAAETEMQAAGDLDTQAAEEAGEQPASAAGGQAPPAEPAEAPAEQPAADENAVGAQQLILPTQANPWFILLRRLPAGDYQIRLSSADAQPHLEAYRIVPERSVTFTIAPDDPPAADSSALTLYRDREDVGQSHTILVQTDAVDFPADRWQIEVFDGNEALAQTAPPTLLAQADGQAGYRWEVHVAFTALGPADLYIRLTCPVTDGAADGLVFRLLSESAAVDVVNRSPAIAAGAATVFPVLTDIPDLKDTPPLQIDLASLFQDPDGDPLTYTILSAGETGGRLKITDGHLVYTPTAGFAEFAVTLQAGDGTGGGETGPHASLSKPLTLTIRQLSVSEALLGLRMTPDLAHLENLTWLEDGACFGVTGTKITLVYRIPWSETLTEILAQAGEEHVFIGRKAAFLDALNLQLRLENENMPKVPAAVLSKSIDGATGDLLATLRLDPMQRSGVFTAYIDASLGDTPLPDLCGGIRINILNSAPYMLADAGEAALFTAEITDYPWTGTPRLPLSDILKDTSVDLSAYFHDEETSPALQYTVLVTGTAAYSWEEDGQVHTSDPAVAEQEITVATREDGSAPLALTVLSAGSLDIAVTAKDAEFASEGALCWQIEIRSAFIRLLLMAGAAALILCVLLAAFLVIRHICKPSFRDLLVSVYALDSAGDEAPAPAQYISLAQFKKKGVSLLSLLLYFQQPPLRTLSARDIGKLMLCPSHKGFAALKPADRALRLQVTPAVPIGGGGYLLTEPRAEISAALPPGDEPGGERIVLLFQQEGGSDGTRPGGIPASDAWDA